MQIFTRASAADGNRSTHPVPCAKSMSRTEGRTNTLHNQRACATLSALLLVLPLFARSAVAAEPMSKPAPTATEVEVSDQARARFQAGVQLLQDPDGARYEEAYEEFKAAYADSPSWKILGNLALCAMKLERDGEAIVALERSVAEGAGQLDPEELAQQERDLKLLKDRAATLTVKSSPGVALLDERVTGSGSAIRNQYRVPESGELVVLVRPGSHRVTAQMSSGPRTLEATLGSGTATEMDLQPAAPAPAETAPADVPAEKASGPSRVPAYISLGVGAAGVVLGGVFLGLHVSSSGQANQIFSDCETSMNCGNDEVDRIDGLDGDAATQGTISLISFGVGAVGIGAGIALLLLPPKKEAPPASGLTVRPYASAHTFGISGQF